MCVIFGVIKIFCLGLKSTVFACQKH